MPTGNQRGRRRALQANELASPSGSAAMGQLLKALTDLADLVRLLLDARLETPRASWHDPHGMTGRATSPTFTISDMCHGYLDEQRRLLAARSPEAIREATLIDYTQSLTRVVAEFGRQNARDWKSSDGAQYLRRCREPDKNGKTRAVRGNREMAALTSDRC